MNPTLTLNPILISGSPQVTKSDWKCYLPSLVFSYNCTKHESTKYSPYELMFGRKPKLPTDKMFESAIDETETSTDYVEDLKKRLKVTQDIVKQHTDTARLKQKTQYDKKAKASQISIGDKVLVRILAFRGKHKIADKFEEEAYSVIGQPNENIPVFKVKAPNGNIKTLHRNHLLPVSSFNDELEDRIEVIANKPVPKPRMSRSVTEKKIPDRNYMEKSNKRREEKGKESDVTEDSDSDSSEDEYVKLTYTEGDAQTSDITDRTTKEIVARVRDNRTGEKDANEDPRVQEESTVVKETDSGTRVEDHTEREEETRRKEVEITQEERSHREREEAVQEDVVQEQAGMEVQAEGTVSRAKPKPRPSITPRQSTRPRKKPRYLEDYHLNQMCVRPIDSRISALRKILDSELLDGIDSEIANKILDAVMNA